MAGDTKAVAAEDWYVEGVTEGYGKIMMEEKPASGQVLGAKVEKPKTPQD